MMGHSVRVLSLLCAIFVGARYARTHGYGVETPSCVPLVAAKQLTDKIEVQPEISLLRTKGFAGEIRWEK